MRERFTVNDEMGGPVYQVEGSLFQIPKQFTIRDVAGRERARVWKKPLSWLPRFFVEVEGAPVATIRKELTFLRPRYTIDGPGITVTGNLWDMSFELLRGGAPIGRVDKRWMSIRDTYAVEIERPEDELVVLGIVLAIDYVKRSESAAAAST
ncbi:LURP-one-related family protein [Xylanimonas ulmi]